MIARAIISAVDLPFFDSFPGCRWNRNATGLYRAMHYRVFYFFERANESVQSTAPEEMSAKSIQEELLCRLDSGDDFLGIMDARDNVLQILRAPGQDRYWVELPVEAARASYGRYMILAEVEELILTLPRVLDRNGIPGLEYRPW